MSAENKIEKVSERKYVNYAFETINEELEFYKKKIEEMETELFKSQIQNKKLELQIGKLQDIIALNSNNKNNTSISFYLPSEFKNQWEIMNKESLLEAFENLWENYYWISHVTQDTFKVVYETTFNNVKEMIFFILKYLNFKLPNDSLFDMCLPKFRNFFQENFSTIFIFKDENFYKIKEQLKNIVLTQYKDFNLKEEFNRDIESKGFKTLIETLHKLFMYMILHDPIITINISSYIDRELQYNFFSKDQHLCIEGFFKIDTPCVIVIPPPMLKKNFAYQSIKPAVYVINLPEEKVVQLCRERNSNINQNDCEKKKEQIKEIYLSAKSVESSPIPIKKNYSDMNSVEERNDTIFKSPSVSKSNDFADCIKEFVSHQKDVNNLPKKLKEQSSATKNSLTEEKVGRIFHFKDRSTSSLDIVIDGDFIESPNKVKEKSCFDHPFSKQKIASITRAENQGTFREDNTLSSIKSFKLKTQKSCEKETNSRSNIILNSARTISNEIHLRDDNEIYNVYQTTSNDNCNEEKFHDIMMNISNSFAFIRQKGFKQNKVDRQISAKLPNEHLGNSTEKIKFSDTGSFSGNVLQLEKYSTNKIFIKDNINRIKSSNENQKIDKNKLEKEMHSNLRRIYSHNNRIKIEYLNQRKLKTLTEKYFNISPKILKVGNKGKQELPNRESIKQFYEEYLNKGLVKTCTNPETNTENKLENNNGKLDKQTSFLTPKSTNKGIYFKHSKTVLSGSEKGNSDVENRDSLITQQGSSVEPKLNKMNTCIFKDNHSKEKNVDSNTNTYGNLVLKGTELKKKIDYCNLKVSKNFRSKIGRLSNLKAFTQIITDQKLDPKKQSLVNPLLKFSLNNE
jgi:hypothetical protein